MKLQLRHMPGDKIVKILHLYGTADSETENIHLNQEILYKYIFMYFQQAATTES